MKVSESILKWLSENKDWFKDAAIVKKVGIDKGNFSKYKKAGDIPEKYHQPIINIISRLGFSLVDDILVENKKGIISQLKESAHKFTYNEKELQKELEQSLGINNKSEIDIKGINERIEVLRKEIAKPPSKMMIPERVYIKVRKDEIAELESKLKTTN